MNRSLQLFCIVYAGIQLPPKPLTANCGVKVAFKETHCLKSVDRQCCWEDLKKNILSKPISQLCDKSEQNNDIKVKYTALYKLYIKFHVTFWLMVSFTISKMARWIFRPANCQKQGSATPVCILEMWCDSDINFSLLGASGLWMIAPNKTSLLLGCLYITFSILHSRSHIGVSLLFSLWQIRSGYK